MDSVPKTIKIDGVEFVRADSVKAPALPGKRAVIVADRGWVFAGDVTRENGRIKLTRAVHCRSWSSIGFDGMIARGKCGSTNIVPISDVDMPSDSELFAVPVGDSWGL